MRFRLSSFFMKITNLIAKTHSKIKYFLIKNFGQNSKANRIIKLFISMLLSSNYYFYIADRGYSKLLVFLGLSFVFYVGISILVFLLKYLYEILKRLRANNVILFILMFYFTNEALSKCKKDAGMENFEIIIISLIISLIIFIFSKSIYSRLKNKKKIATVPLIASGSLLALLSLFLFTNGQSDKSALKYANLGTQSLESPAQFGSKVMEYGNKNPTEVSLLSYVSYSGKKKKVRDTYFNKSLSEVPIKGRIWYPEHKEKSPVLFIAHGNHRFTEENYKGYDYLGRYLARRGYVVISVDMNMLNGFMSYGLSNENDARAILLLENIKEILKLNEDENSKLYNLIDKENIAVLGHSRGGEAVAIAQNYNKLKYNPDNGKEYNYNFNIKGVISVSPTTDQYNPSGKEIKLEDVNYLVMHGTHDKDVTGFQGMKIYDNVVFNGANNNFKSAVYIGYANHGQFNSKWGSADTDPPQSLMINKAALLEKEEQEEILCKYVHEFLENSFGFKDNKDLFKNPQNFDLPKTIYYSKYSDETFNNLVDYEEDYDITTSKSGNISFSGINVSEEKISIGGYETSNTGAVLTNNGKGQYKINFNNLEDAKEYLQFDIMTKNNEDNYKDMNLYIELVDFYDNKSRVEIKDYIDLYPSIKVELSKLQKISKSYKYKGSMQTVRVPIDDFITKSKIVRTDIKEINIGFTDGYSASVVVDNIGFSN